MPVAPALHFVALPAERGRVVLADGGLVLDDGDASLHRRLRGAGDGVATGLATAIATGGTPQFATFRPRRAMEPGAACPVALLQSMPCEVDTGSEPEMQTTHPEEAGR